MIAYTVATGSHMFQERWTSPKPNKVLFIDGEMPLAVMKERLVKIMHSAETKTGQENNLSIITSDLQDQGISDISTPEGQKIIEEHLKDVKLLILEQTTRSYADAAEKTNRKLDSSSRMVSHLTPARHIRTSYSSLQ